MDGETPLHYTAKGDSVDVAHLLIDREAKVDAKTVGWNTPLHLAAKRNSLKVVHLLIYNGANKIIKNRSGKKPIDYSKSYEMMMSLCYQFC